MNLKLFFEEKGLPYTLFEIEEAGEVHIISNEEVIDLILCTQGEERQKMKNMLMKLDFNNCNILTFLKHCAKCYIKNLSKLKI